MTLTLDLSQPLDQEIASEARREGVSESEYAIRLLSFAAHLLREPAAPFQEAVWEFRSTRTRSSAAESPRDEERFARVRSIRGKYAHLGATTEDLHRERRVDESRSEYSLQEHQS